MFMQCEISRKNKSRDNLEYFKLKGTSFYGFKESLFCYTEKKMLLNQKHFFPKACISWI